MCAIASQLDSVLQAAGMSGDTWMVNHCSILMHWLVPLLLWSLSQRLQLSSLSCCLVVADLPWWHSYVAIEELISAVSSQGRLRSKVLGLNSTSSGEAMVPQVLMEGNSTWQGRIPGALCKEFRAGSFMKGSRVSKTSRRFLQGVLRKEHHEGAPSRLLD